MKKLRVALIGCGGRQQCHIAPLLEMEDVEIVAIAEPIDERREAAAKRTGAKRIYKNHTELYDNESAETLDAIFIAIEPTAHTDTETRAIEMGIPFLVEKPMTLDLEKADKIAAMIEEKNLVTAVGLQDRYIKLMEIVKEEVDKRDGGCIVHGRWAGGVPGPWWWQDKKDCGGQLIEQNIHLLDGLRWLFGEPETVYAVNGRGIVKPGIDAKPEYNTDDYSVCMLTFKNNVVATLTSSCYSTKGVRPTCGLHLTYSDIVMDYRLRNNLIMEYKDRVVDIKREERDHTYYLDRAFLDAVVAKDPKAVRSPYSDGLKSLKICFAAEKSMATGEVVKL